MEATTRRNLVALRPAWRHDDDEQGSLKIVMTGSASDLLEWQGHIRNKPAGRRSRSAKIVTIDWSIRENVQAHLRGLVKRVLRKYGYPPDKQEKATQTVLEQAGALSESWAVA